MIFYILAALICYLSFILWKNCHFFESDLFYNYSDNPKVPHVKNGFNLALMSTEQLFHLPRRFAKHFGNKSFKGELFNQKSFLIMKADDAEKILSSSKHLEKGFVYNLLHAFLKTGLLTASSEKWFKRRRMLTPAFHFNILREYFEIFKEQSNRLIEQLNESEGKTVNIVSIATQFTLNSVCEAAMGVNLSKLGSNGVTYRNNIYLIGKEFINRSIKPWLYIDFIYELLGHKKVLLDLLKPVQEFTQSIINERKINFLSNKSSSLEVRDENENIYMSKKKRYAMMDTLLQAQSEGLIDDEGIIEETDNFTFAGHDTTSIATTFSLFLLAHHQDVQQKLFEEIQEFIGDENDFSMDVFNKMPYMDRVLKECLRVYPPVPFIARTLTEDFEHHGVIFEKGTNAEIYIYDIHRDPEYYPDPEKFDPDRFKPENCEKRNNFAFIAFSAGMRNCIGQKFALLELKVMLTKVIQNFIIQPVTKREDLVFIVDMVLRTNHPIELKFVHRK